MLTRHAMLWALMIALSLVGCAVTKQARDVKPSGFLQDLYGQMRPGKGDEALMVYRNPKVDVAEKATYKKILLDPVMIWRGKESKMEGRDPKEAQIIADSFYAILYEELSKDYEMVRDPGPKTFRMQAAIIDAEQSNPALDVISSIPAPMNIAFVASSLKGLTTGKALFKGEASIEAKVSDADTGEVLAAAVDRRVAGRWLNRGAFDSWNAVHAAMKYWAQLTRFRLCHEIRKQTGCVAPES